MVDREKETTVFDVALATSESSFDVLLELNIACESLPRTDVLSKSDPMVVVYKRDRAEETSGVEPGKYGQKVWMEVGRTEPIRNNYSPVFAKAIPIRFVFEEVQELKFVVVDIDEKDIESADLLQKYKNNFLGMLKITLGEIIRGTNSSVKKPLISKRWGSANSSIKITATEVSTNNRFLHIAFAAKNLDKKDLIAQSSDPYLKIYRAEEKSTTGEVKTTVLVEKTEIIKKELNPVWKPMTIGLNKLCKNDASWPLIIECFDWDAEGSHDLIGIVKTTYGELFNKKEFDIISPEKANRTNYKNSGVLLIKQIQEFKLPSFVDYINGGTEVCLVVAIDYTASNGEPDDPKALHYIAEDGAVLNPYVNAIRAVGEVVAPYDSDKLYPAFGFGAKLVPLGNQTSHCFPVNHNEDDPNCAGVDGLVEAYVNSFDELTLAGPTNFAPIIHRVLGMAKEDNLKQKGSKYYILLIITDGEVQDMEKTKAIINAACDEPMSIIVVGVGSNDFDKMVELDADQKVAKQLSLERPKDEKKKKKKKRQQEEPPKPLSKVFERDIVQFVPFKFFEDKPYYQLAKHTLAEVPRQLIEFMTKHRIAPLKPNDVPIGAKHEIIL